MKRSTVKKHPRRSRGAAARGERKAPPRRLVRRIMAAMGLVGLLCLGALFAWSLMPNAVIGERGVWVEFDVTASDKAAVVEGLERAGLVESPILLTWYARLLTPHYDFAERPHLLERGISARKLVQRLAEVGARDRVKVTIPEGYNHVQIAGRLQGKGVCSQDAFVKAVWQRDLLDELSLSAPSAEGYLFPATYELYMDERPEVVVRKLVQQMHRRLAALTLAQQLPAHFSQLNWGTWELVVLGSIVQKETASEREAPRIARVFLNRLLFPEAETSGRLQSDPTAGYGCLVERNAPPSCRAYSGSITPEILRDAHNPYNTYRHAGLPPGPISNPGEVALRAVLAPAEGDDLYFVADGNGGHTFTDSYSEHLKAVKKLRAIRGRGGQ